MRILPHVFLIHLGVNDLGLMKGKVLVIWAKVDFQFIQQKYPDVLIIWSALLPRLSGERKGIQVVWIRPGGKSTMSYKEHWKLGWVDIFLFLCHCVRTRPQAAPGKLRLYQAMGGGG